MLSPKRILAIHVTRIGDTLLCGPSLRALRQAFPDAAIDFLGHPKRYQVLLGFPGLRRVASINKTRARWMGWLACIMRRWRGYSYDLAVVWGNDITLVHYALRVAQQVVAPVQADEKLNRRLYAAVTMPSDAAIPLADWQLALIEQSLEISTAERYVEYRVDDAEARWAKAYLAPLRKTKGRLVGLIVETFQTYAHRDWPIEHFAELLRLLNGYDPKLCFLLLGAKLPQHKIDVLRSLLGERLLLAAGKLSIRQSAALIDELDLYIGLDTGPSHIVAALSIPAVILFHCMRRGPLVLSPRRPEAITLLEHPLASEYCSFATSMAAIRPHDVFKAICCRLEQGSNN